MQVPSSTFLSLFPASVYSGKGGPKETHIAQAASRRVIYFVASGSLLALYIIDLILSRSPSLLPPPPDPTRVHR